MKKVRVVAATLIIILLSNLRCFSQKWEIGIGGGVSYYVGDLNPTGHFLFPNPSGTIFVKRFITNRWSIRGGISYMGLNADDQRGDWGYMQTRNLNFRSHLMEAHVAMELNFFAFGIKQ